MLKTSTRSVLTIIYIYIYIYKHVSIARMIPRCWEWCVTRSTAHTQPHAAALHCMATSVVRRCMHVAPACS